MCTTNFEDVHSLQVILSRQYTSPAELQVHNSTEWMVSMMSCVYNVVSNVCSLIYACSSWISGLTILQ